MSTTTTDRPTSYCAKHDREEPSLNAYRVCPHCGHVYRQRRDVAALYNEAVDALNATGWDPPASRLAMEDVDTVPFCQVCMRDW